MLVVAATLGSARADTYWTNEASTGNWSDANNWDNGLPDAGDNAIIENLTALTWPRLDGGIGQCKQLQIAYNPNMLGELTVTGGATLDVYGDLRIARKSPGGEIGTLYISDLGTCIIGREDIEVGRYGDATIDISGGYLCTAGDGYLNLAYHTGSFGTIYLRGGTVEVGTGGLTIGKNQTDIGTALIDIYDGVLIIAGDAVSTINDYVSQEPPIIIGYGGLGTICAVYDAGKTMVTAFGPGENIPPVVDAGEDKTLILPDYAVKLDGTVTDDGIGDPNGYLDITWSVQSQPDGSTVYFDNNKVEDSIATFDTAGDYVLFLYSTDGEKSSGDVVTVTVYPEGYVPPLSVAYIVTRLNGSQPIIDQDMFEAVGVGVEGDNINGPSVIRVPDWIAPENRTDPDAVYYMYFAEHHHRGGYIRMAWAEHLEGPWQLYRIGSEVNVGERGVLDLGNSEIDLGNGITIYNHIASPDVFAHDENQRIILYFHGPTMYGGSSVGQNSFVATSEYGLDFNGNIEPVVLGGSYFRVFSYNDNLYALDNGADLYSALDADNPWTPPRGFDFGDDLWIKSFNDPFQDDLGDAGFSGRIRHTAVHLTGDTLQVFYSRIGDTPERIQMSTIDLSVGSYDLWDSTYPPEEILEAEPGWEGGQFPPEPSKGGHAPENVNQLRDPYVFEDIDGVLYLFYSGCGEDAIGVAHLDPVVPGDFDFDGCVRREDQ